MEGRGGALEPSGSERRRGVLTRLAALAALALIAGGIFAVVRTSSDSDAAGHRPPHLAVSAHRRVRHRPSFGQRELAAAARLASYGLPLYCGGSAKPMVALTFDDGPGVYTKLALRKLRAHGARATFFLVGKELPVWPGLAQLEKPLAAFGDHTMTHQFLPGLGAAALASEIGGAQRLLARTTGRRVLLFRPPYGARSAAVDALVRRLHMVEVLWNVDTGDSLGANYLAIERNAIAGLHRGSIILMHENRGQTIRALSPILAAIRQRHLKAVSLLTLITQDPPSMRQLRAGARGCPVSLRLGSGA
jgi:peptidoglycan/xylan/chitin deacetylase (PgdA/CDA1 family)